jgi:DNA-binding response OmpR family regulator
MLPSLGKYLLAGLDLGCDIPKPRYLSHPINFTKTETMIIRYLTVTYPDYVSAEDILRHSLKPGKIAEPSVIRAHISSINKKFKELRNRPLVISDPGKGYVILTPEINERTKVINNT